MLIPKTVFEIHRCASWDQGRWQLEGVRVERVDEETCRAAATDGKVMAIATWKDENREEYPSLEGVTVDAKEDFAATIRKPDCKAAAELPKRVPGKPILGENVVLDEQNANGKVTLAATDLDSTSRQEVEPIDGIYPNYQSVLEGRKETHNFRVDARKLIQTLETLLKASGVGKRDNAHVNVSLADNAPLKFELTEKGAVDVQTYLMPVWAKDD